MGKPIFILAGQSNARALRDATRAALEQKYGTGNFVLVEISDAGAPLTYKRSGEDWAEQDELRHEMAQETIRALAADAGNHVAGIIWVQGEADTHAIARPEEYAERLAELMADFRLEVAEYFSGHQTGVETAKLIVSGLSEHAPDAGGRSWWDDVIAAQKAYAAQSETAVLVVPDQVADLGGMDPGAMFLDGLHYSMAFRDMLAQALVEATSNGVQDRPTPGQDDVLAGTLGADVLAGGEGNDLYLINHRHDRVVERAGQGVDGVVSEKTVRLKALSDNLEHLTLEGKGNVKGAGNRQDNIIFGNDGDNVLNGVRGDDFVFGGAGDDVLISSRGHDNLHGGRGHDTYVVDQAGLRIFEGQGEGRDHVISSVSFTLRFHSQDLETLQLAGTDAIDGTGNGKSNLITGNDGANRLDGAWGNDTIRGGKGNDILIGHRGDDLLNGGPGRDTFLFSPGHGNDRITGFNTAKDRLAFDDGIERLDLTVEKSGQDARVFYGEADSVLLQGVSVSELDATEFVLL